MGIALLLFLGIVALLAVWFIGGYNMLVGMRQDVKNAWAQIDVQLKRRHDLIPNLVEAVKGYMQHERQTLENVIKARQQAVSAEGLQGKAQAENFLTQSLRSLFAVAEKYPDLRANQNVMHLQEELTSTENQIGSVRRAYNDQATRYNTAIQTIPTNLIASAGGFHKADLFELNDPAQREAPQVKF